MKSVLATFVLFLGFGAQAQTADFAGCTPATATTIDAPSVQIGISGMSYTPKCVRIRRGTSVTIPASGFHPLQGVGAGNPLFDPRGGATSTKTVVFTQPGTFGYFCEHHGDEAGNGMAGAVIVE